MSLQILIIKQQKIMLKYSAKARQSVQDIMDQINSNHSSIHVLNLNQKPQNSRPSHVLISPRLSQEVHLQATVTPKTIKATFTHTKNKSQIPKSITSTPQKDGNRMRDLTNTIKLRNNNCQNIKEISQNFNHLKGYIEPKTDRPIFNDIINKQQKQSQVNKFLLRQTVSNSNSFQTNNPNATIKFLQSPDYNSVYISSKNVIEDASSIIKRHSQNKNVCKKDQPVQYSMQSQVKPVTRDIKAIIADIAQLLPTFSNNQYKKEPLSNYSSVRYRNTIHHTPNFDKLRQSQSYYMQKSPLKNNNLRQSEAYSCIKSSVSHRHSNVLKANFLQQSVSSNDYLRNSKPISNYSLTIRYNNNTLFGLKEQNYKQNKKQSSSKISPNLSKQKIIPKAFNINNNTSKTNIEFIDGLYAIHQNKKYQTNLSTKQSIKQITVKDFQLGQCKGEGRFGKFFPAIHLKTGMIVGIKQIKKEAVRSMLHQFTQQIKISLFLDHPNLVKMYGFFHDQTNFYIIMEYMEEGSLYKMIKTCKKLTEQATAVKLKQICDAVDYMHENDILHRDLKPQNIVVTNGVSKLCDFGWAAYSRGRRSTYCGTLDYVCPQILEGQTYDNFVDIWSIGVLAFEMLVGRAPFYHISRELTIKNITKCDFTFPSELGTDAKKFIMKALQKNPDERFTIGILLRDKFLLNVNKL